jgi:hypothetical protein
MLTFIFQLNLILLRVVLALLSSGISSSYDFELECWLVGLQWLTPGSPLAHPTRLTQPEPGQSQSHRSGLLFKRQE